MQITRAIKQLQRLKLFDVSKDGVKVVIGGKDDRRAMFENAKACLIDSVRKILYIPHSQMEAISRLQKSARFRLCPCGDAGSIDPPILSSVSTRQGGFTTI
ncbi:MAG: hypothetical protein LBU32_28945 [Clostridiales bacterium]|nr:hypothetical protein [Clostridiales bacterium]